MALMKCQECGNEVSTDAKACPHCGAKPIPPKPPKKPMGIITKAFLAIFSIMIIVGLASPQHPANTAPATPTATNATTSTAPVMLWSYPTEQDNMTGKPIRYAQLLSLTSVDLSFPYGPGINATIALRKHPRYGKDVYITLDKGQILCNGYDGCSVLIRFDDHKPVTFPATQPSDNSTNTVFIHNYTKFIAELKHAKLMTIELPMYQDGNQTWQFKVDGLKWS